MAGREKGSKGEKGSGESQVSGKCSRKKRFVSTYLSSKRDARLMRKRRMDDGKKEVLDAGTGALLS